MTDRAMETRTEERPHRHSWLRVGGPPDEPWDDNVYLRCSCGKSRPYPRANDDRFTRAAYPPTPEAETD